MCSVFVMHQKYKMKNTAKITLQFNQIAVMNVRYLYMYLIEGGLHN